MLTPAQSFKKAFGVADPRATPGVRFESGMNRGLGEAFLAEVGAGWFREGFLYLLGEGLQQLHECLDAWSFVVPRNANRLIVGRNAYGAILVLDNASEPRIERVYVLDPFTVSYDEVPNARFISLIGRAFPRGELQSFLDDRAYRAWLQQHQVGRLEPQDVLGIKVPKSLGGELVADNLQLEDIVSYYQTTAPIYAKAFAQLNKEA